MSRLEASLTDLNLNFERNSPTASDAAAARWLLLARFGQHWGNMRTPNCHQLPHMSKFTMAETTCNFSGKQQ
jgi:hypothetical protein